MSVQAQSYDITLDGSGNPQPLTLNPPAGSGSTVWRWIVIQNVSPFVALCTGIDDTGINTAAVAPNTQDRFQFTNIRGPVKVTWANPIAGSTPPGIPKIIVMFSDDPSGSDLAGSYPSPIASPINIGTITSGTVTIAGGSVAVSSISGTVTIAGNVNVTGGTVAVSSISGTVTVAGNVNITNASLTVTGSVSISGTPSVTISGTPNVNVSGGSIAISSGSVAITGNVTVQQIVQNVNVNQAVLSLLNTNNTFTLGSSFSPALSSPTTPFESMRLTLQNASLTLTQILTVLVKNTTTGQSWQGTLQGVSQAATPPYSIIAIPVAANVGDSLTIKFTNVTNPGTINMELVGLADGDTIMTAPGLPISSYIVGGSLKVRNINVAASADLQILPAPPAGFAYRLHLWAWRPSTASIPTIGDVLLWDGTTYVFADDPYGVWAGASGGKPGGPLDGVLTVTPVYFFNVTNQQEDVHLHYDLVAIPNIS